MSTGAAGLLMLLTLGVATVVTGLPVWALLIAVASAFAAVGVVGGVFPLHVLAALPGRITGLLEHDLLQALPLYVLVGLLLQRLQLAGDVFDMLRKVLRRSGAGDGLAGLWLGALIAPLNGSVASSSAMLGRMLTPRLTQRLAPAQTTALVSVAATVGVVVPPSLVLLLLGDALMRAHTEAQRLPGAVAATRIINTQDLFHAAIVPSLALLVLWSLLAWWQGRRSGAVPEALPRLPVGKILQALAAVLALLGLLISVTVGWMLAVEAAATASVTMILLALVRRSLSAADWVELLQETMVLTGALFALLLGATTFSLVFWLFGTDRWLAEALAHATLPPAGMATVLLLGVAACAWVLDAFEMIFVVIPLIAPHLIVRMGDAQQAGVLLLLVLQMSFLLPPMGYAVLLARARVGPTALSVLLRAMAPYLAVQVLVTLAVAWWPASVHVLDSAAPAGEASSMSLEEAEKAMLDMGQ